MSKGRVTITTDQAPAWFREAVRGTRYAVPDNAAISVFVDCVNRYDPPAAPPIPRPKSATHGRAFANALRKEARELIARYPEIKTADQLPADLLAGTIIREVDSSFFDLERAMRADAMGKMEAAVNAVEAFLDWENCWRTKQNPVSDEAEFVSFAARTAWLTTGTVPTGEQADSPLVKLVAAALCAVGTIELDADSTDHETISQYLRGKRGNGLLRGFKGDIFHKKVTIMKVKKSR